MGFRIRRSINLGGGFKVNLSKSGIGYSWGANGFRVTKKCRGGTRTTTSIPGTGLSYVKETKKKTNPVSNSNSEDVRHSQPEQHKTHVAQTYDTQTIENSTADLLISEGLEDMLSLAAKIIKFYKLIWLSLWISLFLGCICGSVQNKYFMI